MATKKTSTSVNSPIEQVPTNSSQVPSTNAQTPKVPIPVATKAPTADQSGSLISFITLEDGTVIPENPVMVPITYNVEIIDPSKIRLISEIDYNICALEILIAKIRFEIEQIKSQKASFQRQDLVDIAKERAATIQKAIAAESLKKKKEMEDKEKKEEERPRRNKKMNDELL